MVRLNAEQDKYIGKLQEARKVMDRRIADAEAEARIKRAEARAEVSNLIGLAIQAGIPSRQIAIKGLGYADVSSLKTYINPEYPSHTTGTSEREESFARRYTAELTWDAALPDEILHGTLQDGTPYTVVFDTEYGQERRFIVYRDDDWANSVEVVAIEKAVTDMLHEKFDNAAFTWIERS